MPGANLVLTIDAELQRLAEKAVARVAAAAVVIVEVEDRQACRAVVCKPSFDPNVMTGHLTRAEETLLMQDPRKPFIDKALRATLPAGLDVQVRHRARRARGRPGRRGRDRCSAPARTSSRARTFRCNGDARQDRPARARSSTRATSTSGSSPQRIGLDRIAEVAREFGFGAPTNLGLNGDAGGRIPTKAWYEQHGRYKVGYATNAATGQGDVEVTVLQMAMAYAALANGGTLYVPQVVERVEAPTAARSSRTSRRSRATVKIPADALDMWRRGMWKVINEPGGTAFDHGHSRRRAR